MHRAVRVAEYWNWLPAFRAVAETQNLRDAAERIHVAPSAISRTLRLLEDSLGYSLFERTTSTLSLNAAGRRLLDAVRTSMRMVNEAHVGGAVHDGPCQIHCPTDLVPLLLDMLATWSTMHPASPPLVHVPCTEDVGAQLVRGDLDIALAFEPAAHPGILSALLGEVSSGLYCAPSHPASRLQHITESELAELPFVDYPAGELAFIRTIPDREKQRVAYLPTMELAVRLASRGVGLVYVPDFVVESTAPELVRLPWPVPTARLYLWFRRPVVPGRPAIVEFLVGQKRFRSLVHSPPPPTRKRRRA